MSPAREIEANLVKALTQAARSGRPPESHHEADLFRFAAQLLKTWHPEEADALDAAALQHFAHCDMKPKSFPQIAADGKIGDVARFRRAMENSLAGIVHGRAHCVPGRLRSGARPAQINVDHLRMNLRDVLAMARKRHLQGP